MFSTLIRVKLFVCFDYYGSVILWLVICVNLSLFNFKLFLKIWLLNILFWLDKYNLKMLSIGLKKKIEQKYYLRRTKTYPKLKAIVSTVISHWIIISFGNLTSPRWTPLNSYNYLIDVINSTNTKWITTTKTFHHLLWDQWNFNWVNSILIISNICISKLLNFCFIIFYKNGNLTFFYKVHHIVLKPSSKGLSNSSSYFHVLS